VLSSPLLCFSTKQINPNILFFEIAYIKTNNNKITNAAHKQHHTNTAAENNSPPHRKITPGQQHNKLTKTQL